MPCAPIGIPVSVSGAHPWVKEIGRHERLPILREYGKREESHFFAPGLNPKIPDRSILAPKAQAVRSMKSLTIFLMVLIGRVLPISGQPPVSSGHTFWVYLFLLEDCKITQAYTDKLRSLHSSFACDSIRFEGFFPSPVSTDSTMQAFVAKHRLPFPCTRSGAYAMAKRFGVSVTPEVVVYNETIDSVYYQGRIDNLYERVGQRRQVVTSHELEAALYCIQHCKPISVPRTVAVGCFLK